MEFKQIQTDICSLDLPESDRYECSGIKENGGVSHILKANNRNIIINAKNKVNGLDLLDCIKENSVKTVFFDPQYRGVLDKLSYGNEGKKRGKARSGLPQMTNEIILAFISKIEKILVSSGYLFLWVDKFHLVEGVSSWVVNAPKLSPVDMITWNKERIGMGYRTRRQSEYLVVIQKEPKRAKSTWSIHNIPDVWSEKVNKEHPHSKPIGLQSKLIEATTVEGDAVCDPASGGYSVLECCKRLNRTFIGCDLVFGDDNQCG